VAEIIRPADPYTPECQFADVRAALGRMAKVASPKARAVDRWCLQPDLAKSVADLTVQDDNGERGKLHAIVVGVVGFTPLTETTGGGLVEWLVELRVAVFRWYEFGTNASNSQEVVEREARLMAALVTLNRDSLAMDNPAAARFRGVTRNLEFPRDNIDIVGFAEGVSAHMALGSMQVKVQEEIVTA